MQELEADTEETLRDTTEAGEVSRLLEEIRYTERNQSYKDFVTTGNKVQRVYTNKGIKDQQEAPEKRSGFSDLNIFWSTVQTLKPVYYARLPKPVAERRLKSEDPVKRLACIILERCTKLSLDLEADNFNSVMDSAVEDRLLPGRGMAFVQFHAEFEGEMMKPLSERAETKYINWRDFNHNTARTWREVKKLWDIAYLTKEECKKEYGAEIAEQISYTFEPDELKDSPLSNGQKSLFRKAKVYVVWDKITKKVYHVTEGYKQGYLKVLEDPYKLDGFWPCPEPLLATTTNDSLIPIADYKITEAILDEINEVMRRLIALRPFVKFCGAVDGNHEKDIKNVVEMLDGDFWPVKNFTDWATKGGLKGLVDYLPIENITTVMTKLTEYLEYLIAKYWDVSGIPDIVRGSSDPRETAKAQQQKGDWTVLRIQKKQQDVQRFARELISKKGELIMELFSDATIAEMSGYSEMTEEEQMMFPMALQLLRNDTLRIFKLDIETDSTLAVDEEQDKASRLEFLNQVTQAFERIEGIMGAHPELMTPLLETVMFAVRGFRQGLPLEGVFERAAKEIDQNYKAQMEAAQNQPPPVDPAQLKAEADMQIAQAKMGIEQMKAQMQSQLAEQKAQHEMQLKEYQVSSTLDLKHRELELDTQLKAEKIRADMAESLLKVNTAQDGAQIREAQAMQAANTQPVVVNVTIPSGKKLIQAQRDPATGMLVGQVSDVQEVA